MQPTLAKVLGIVATICVEAAALVCAESATSAMAQLAAGCASVIAQTRVHIRVGSDGAMLANTVVGRPCEMGSGSLNLLMVTVIAGHAAVSAVSTSPLQS